MKLHEGGVAAALPRKPYVQPELIRRGTLSRVTADANVLSLTKTVSDLRLKEGIHQIGFTAHGLPYYNFRYLGQPDVYEGVMAQDVLAVVPDAVVLGSDGYLRVNYEMLGVPFRRVH